MATTKTKRPKKAKKGPPLRGGTNQPAEPIPMAAAELVTTEADDKPLTEADVDAAEATMPGPLSDAIDQVVSEVVDGKANAKPAPDSPERLAEWDAATRRLLSECAAEVDRAEKEHEAKKEAAKAAKEALEFAWKDQHKTIKEREANRGKPVQGDLFEKPTTGHAAAQPDLREPGEVPPVEDDSWKAVPLAELVEKDGLPQKVADLLANAEHKDRGALAPIATMGDLVKYQEPERGGYQKRLTDLKGFGPAKEEALSKATESFWKRWKPHANATRPADAGEGGKPGDTGAGSEPATPGEPPPPAEPAEAPAGNQPDGGQPADATVDTPAESTHERNGDGKSTAEPAGYRNADVDRNADTKRKS